MMQTKFPTRVFGCAILALLMSMMPASAQSSPETGKLKIQVSPRQSYVFVDGKAIRDGSQTIDLAAGTHEVSVNNYGYIPKSQKIHIGTGETTKLAVTLQSSGDMVSGPFGDIEFKGHPRAAVLLNGNTPDYFVGHVDEFDNNFIWHQWLLAKPGNYQVTVTRKGQTIWSGPVDVKACKRDVVDLNHKGEIETKNFKPGLTLGPQPRFDAGIASAVIPIAPVTAQLTASQTQAGCGLPITLNWKADDAVNTSITNIGNVPARGDRTVTPTQPTTYELVAKGPGGEVTKTVAVNVNSQPTVTLNLSEPEVHFHKIGDKVVQDDSTTLQWSTSYADKVTITPLGSEAANGSQTDPAPAIDLASLFYPTNYPTARHPKVGLLVSQQSTLEQIAKQFKDYQQYKEKASLLIVGHTDVRKSKKYNLALSERRADLVKTYLVSKGISADEIQIRAVGKENQLSEDQVTKLQMKDREKPEKGMKRSMKVTWPAYNRRVDVILEPTGQKSADVYPNDAPEAHILWQRPEPSLKSVESASQMAKSTTAQALSSVNSVTRGQTRTQ